jgi:hypothetical protein
MDIYHFQIQTKKKILSIKILTIAVDVTQKVILKDRNDRKSTDLNMNREIFPVSRFAIKIITNYLRMFNCFFFENNIFGYPKIRHFFRAICHRCPFYKKYFKMRIGKREISSFTSLCFSLNSLRFDPQI